MILSVSGSTTALAIVAMAPESWRLRIGVPMRREIWINIILLYHFGLFFGKESFSITVLTKIRICAIIKGGTKNSVSYNKGGKKLEERKLVTADSLSKKEIEEIERQYEIYAAECNAAMRLALSRITNLREAIDRSGNRNPFDRIESRIKTFKSVIGKCEARGYDFTIECIRDKIKDIAGIRIITKYLDEVMVVRHMIAQIPGVNIVAVKDYVTKPKPNGYSSMHLGCQIEIHDPYKGSQLIPVEIQLRSKSMNLWATLEHDLKYKNENPSPEVEEKFRRISKLLRNFDEEAMELRDYNEVEVNNIGAIITNF